MVQLRIIVLVACAIVCGSIAAADRERNSRPDANSLSAILERIRGHAAGRAWQVEGWSDATIEQWLLTTTTAVTTAAGQPGYQLPVKFAEVQAADPAGRRLPLDGGHLVVGSDLKLAHVHRSIILADGNAELSFADSCVVVARGAVSIAHASNCLVIAGAAVEISHDGNGLPGPGAGSIVLSRGWIDVGHAKGTCLVAHEGAIVSHANGVIFVGPEPKTSHRDAACKVVKLPLAFPMEPRPADALEGKLKVVGTVRPKGLVFHFDGKRYVADVHKPITDEAGAAVAALAAWKVTFVGDETAVFSNGQVDAPFRLPPGE